MTELKLTPTFADNVKQIEAQHEPLSGNGGTIWSFPPGVPASAPVVVAEPQKRKVAIIGTAPSSRDLAPYNDPSWEIWACSPGNKGILPRVTRWYEIHVNLMWPENKHYGEPYLQWLNEQAEAGKFEVWMQDQRYVAKAKSFPKDKMVKEFGPYFFTSTFAWLMAQAISEGVGEIALYGVDMASRDEYILQRPGGYYFILEAKKRDIRVTIPFESDLEQPPGLYGYSENTPYLRKLLAREQELKARIAPMQQQIAQLQSQVQYLSGALEDLDYWKSIWGSAQDGLELRRSSLRNNGANGNDNPLSGGEPNNG